jgi:hypothetical protein
LILTDEEKRTILIAVVAGAAVLFFYFGVRPLWNRWTDLGRALDAKLELVAKLDQRAKAQKELLARRDSLAREIGAVEGRATPPGPGQNAPPSAPGRNVPPPAPLQGASPSVTGSGAAPSVTAAPPGSTPPSVPASAGQPAATNPPGPASVGAAPASTEPPHPVALVAYVERQGMAAGIPFSSITPFTPALGCRSGRSLSPAGVVVTFQAATPSFLRFLYALEKGDRLTRIEQMELHRDPAKGPMITATLHIAGYESAAR